MTIVVYKRLTRNPEIGNTSVCFFPNICRLGRVRDTKFATNVSNEMLQNVAKCKGYSFPRFRVIQANPTEGGGVGLNGLLPPIMLDLVTTRGNTYNLMNFCEIFCEKKENHATWL